MEKKIEEIKKKGDRYKIVLIVLLIINFIVVPIILGLYILHVGATTTADKPIIYLYPKQETSIVIKLGKPEKLSCSYPKYTENGWQVVAKPDGTLIDSNTGKELYSLYWEGFASTKAKTNDGFVVKGEDTASFLEEKLKILGLTSRESEEFIIYWLPKLEANKYNYIRFASIEEINEYMPLSFSVQPDTLIRILMEYKPLNKYIEIPEQRLTTPERTGFVAVEWGGTEIK